jgi:ABC-2 type transport system permease protein
LGYGAVFITFLLILMLGGQTVGTLAEEKGNKVIEILAAAIPMESVFYGKLIGMLGVALLFIGFWGGVVAIGGSAVVSQFGGADGLASVATAPAVGWPLFLLLALAYFLMGFMLLGAVFLGLGALASSVREIQMLSLPITLFQVGMFTLGSIAANLPGSTAALVAQWLPWSSPYAMIARAARDPALWPHGERCSRRPAVPFRRAAQRAVDPVAGAPPPGARRIGLTFM